MLNGAIRVSLACGLLIGSAISAQGDRQAPIINTISKIIPSGTQTITITGSHFGTQPPYKGDSDFILLKICKYHRNIRRCVRGWEAGYEPNGDEVGLNVTSWTDTQIVISGFTNYGRKHTIETNDTVYFTLWNFPSLRSGNKSRCHVRVGDLDTDCH